MDYSQYSVEKFIEDAWFRAWVVNHDKIAEQYWLTWIKENPEHKEKLEEAKDLLKSMVFPEYSLGDDEVAKLWEKVQPRPSLRANKKRKNYMLFGVAASVGLIATMCLLFWGPFSQRVVYTTNYGETRTITLPDHSIVELNANSQLSFNDDWDGAASREVMLEGEAFFSVVHKTNHQPFLVRTSEGVAVEVLGTSFNVYHRTDDTKIFLETGKISLTIPTEQAGKTSKKIMMSPGELVEYSHEKYVKRKVEPEKFIAWKDRKLTLDHTSLGEIVQRMKDSHGVEIEVIPNELLKETVSGSIPLTDRESLLHHIAKAFQLEIRYENERVIFFEPDSEIYNQ